MQGWPACHGGDLYLVPSRVTQGGQTRALPRALWKGEESALLAGRGGQLGGKGGAPMRVYVSWMEEMVDLGNYGSCQVTLKLCKNPG